MIARAQLFNPANRSTPTGATWPRTVRGCVLLIGLALAAGCGPAAQPRPDKPAKPSDATGLGARPASGRPGVAPARRANSLDPAKARAAAARAAAATAAAGGVPPVGADTLLRLSAYADGLKNAALRDRSMERTMRTYMLITREVFRRLRTAGSGNKGSASYNPVPAWRFQAQVQRDLRALADRAGVLERHLGQLAETAKPTAVPASKSAADKASKPALTGRSRSVRIALFRNIFTCIRRDTWLRARHGQAWANRPTGGQESQFDEMARARLYRQELQMMRTSVRCSTLIARRRAAE